MSYHTPKVYRSSFGCCICRAKSSSSRFTDSSRYESDFRACFKLEEPRYGEICNACVLLIKRWKKLPVGTKRNWNHVVDARARPRGRGTTRSDNIQSASFDTTSTIDRLSRLKLSKNRYIRKKTRAGSPAESEDHFADDRLSEASGTSVPSSRAPSPSPSPSPYPSEDETLSIRSGSSKRKQEMPLRSKYKYYRYEDFINYGYWRKVKVCCSYAFVGLNEEILYDPSLFKSCCSMAISASQSQSDTPPPLAIGGLSDGGSVYEEDLEFLDDETSSSPGGFYGPSTQGTEEEGANLLSHLAVAIGT